MTDEECVEDNQIRASDFDEELDDSSRLKVSVYSRVSNMCSSMMASTF